MDEAGINRRARLLFAGVLAAVFLAGGLWLLVSSAAYTAYEIRTHDPVSGLIADAPVEFHGVEVGRVRGVELTGPRSVSVVLEVRRGVPVNAGTVATITARGLAMRGFTGYVYVSLENTGPDSRSLEVAPGMRYPVIASGPAEVVNLDLAVNQVNANVQSLTTLVQALLDGDTVASLKDSVASVERVSRTLADNNAKLAGLLVNAELASRDAPGLVRSTRATLGRIDTLLDPQTVASLRQLAASLEQVTGMLAANNAKLDTLIANGEDASRELAPLMQSTRDTVTLLQGQVLPEAYKTLSHLDDLTVTLGVAARKVNRDPSVLIRGASPAAPGPGETR